MKSKLILFGLFAVILFCVSPFSFTQTNCESARKEYLEKNPDVKNAGIDPWSHFNYYGKKEGRIWPNCSENIKSSTKIMNYVNDYVQIGDQYWTNTNLNVSVFNNGDSILCVKDAKSWQNACLNRKSAWCYFNFDPSTEKKFGKLYNLWAVTDPRGINPNGWHIPTKEDWIKLLEKNGNSFQNFPSANAMRTDNIEKYKTSNGWDKYSEFINGKQIYHESNGTNSTLLSVCPSGSISFEGSFDKPNLRAEFWTSTVAPSTPNGSPCYFSVELQNNRIYIKPSVYATGLSIRCISNDTPPTIPTTSTETKQNDIISTYASTTIDGNIPTTDELTQKLETIKDKYEKIKYLNSVIQAINLSPSMSNYKQNATCYFQKLLIELPELYDDPSITLSEWQENLNFIESLGNDFGASKKNENELFIRGWYLFFRVLLKQKINGQPDINDLKLIISEFNQDNFPPGAAFYNNIKEVLEQANNNYSSNTNSGNSTNTPSKPKITKEEFKKHVIYENASTTECVLCHRKVYCTKRSQKDINEEIDINYTLVTGAPVFAAMSIFGNISKGVTDPNATFVKTYNCDSHCADCKMKYGFTH